jgi:predicted ATPase
MLDRFIVKNFKSFREARLALRPLTVLIGANASGKTNLLEALQLLSWMASGRQLGQVLSAIRDEELGLRGTLPEWTWNGNADPIHFECHLELRYAMTLDLAVDEPLGARISSETLSHDSHDVPLYKALVRNQEAHTLTIEYNNFARGGIKPVIEGSALQPVFTQLTTGARFAAKHQQSQEVIPRSAREVTDALQKILFLDPSPRVMRGYSHELDRSLRADGANVSSVLHHLSHGDERNAVLRFVQALPEQDIAQIGFLETPRGEVMVQLEETFGGHAHWREAAVLSDGTLRALAIAAALLSVEPGSTVVIEEVDNGIHPPRVGQILGLMRETAERRKLRILVTTHNPALLDAIPDREIQHVVACYRDRDEGDSRLVTLGKLDQFPALVARGSLGELVARGILERTLRSTESEEQRKQSALRWLDELEREA